MNKRTFTSGVAGFLIKCSAIRPCSHVLWGEEWIVRIDMSAFEDKFCGGKFWDENVTWYTEWPDFTPCFHKTILQWTPSLIFIVFGLNEGRKYPKSLNREIPWNFLNLAKVLLTTLLLLLSIIEIVFTIITDNDDNDLTNIWPVDYVTNVVFLLTYLGWDFWPIHFIIIWIPFDFALIFLQPI